jgi:hypothetical protein
MTTLDSPTWRSSLCARPSLREAALLLVFSSAFVCMIVNTEGGVFNSPLSSLPPSVSGTDSALSKTPSMIVSSGAVVQQPLSAEEAFSGTLCMNFTEISKDIAVIVMTGSNRQELITAARDTYMHDFVHHRFITDNVTAVDGVHHARTCQCCM